LGNQNGKFCLTEEQLETILTEAEAVINSLVHLILDLHLPQPISSTRIPEIEIDNPQDPVYRENNNSGDELLEL